MAAAAGRTSPDWSSSSGSEIVDDEEAEARWAARRARVQVSPNRRRATYKGCRLSMKQPVRDVLDGMVRGEPGAVRGLFLRWEPRFGRNAPDVSDCEPLPTEPTASFELVVAREQKERDEYKPLEDYGDSDKIPSDADVWNTLARFSKPFGGNALVVSRCRLGGSGATLGCLVATVESLSEHSGWEDPDENADILEYCARALVGGKEDTLEGRPFIWLPIQVHSVPRFGAVKEKYEYLDAAPGRDTKRAT